MSFMADYGPEFDEEERAERSEWDDVLQRWAVVAVFLTAILFIKVLI